MMNECQHGETRGEDGGKSLLSLIVEMVVSPTIRSAVRSFDARVFQYLLVVKAVAGIHEVEIITMCLGNTLVHGVIDPNVWFRYPESAVFVILSLRMSPLPSVEPPSMTMNSKSPWIVWCRHSQWYGVTHPFVEVNGNNRVFSLSFSYSILLIGWNLYGK